MRADFRRLSGSPGVGLRAGGVVLNIHNEQLNIPATAISTKYLSLNPVRERLNPRYLMPSDRWQPSYDIEFCVSDVASIESALATLGPSGTYLQQYIRAFYPNVADLQGVSAAVAPRPTPQVFGQIRQTVAQIRETCDVSVEDKSIAQLLASRIEPVIGSEQLGFETIFSGTFEIRKCVRWQTCFGQRPAAKCFVRGLTTFGYSTDESPPPMTGYRQELNDAPARKEGEIELVGYQYGFVGRKRNTAR